jgi:UDP-N-acetylmuramyl pentapeptide phosphotransferase/UDP-N-acetylglucosamine-1-phosphate transferase
MLTSLALAFMVATIVSMTLTPLSIQWAQRLGIVARPSARKVHREPVPSWGGIALTIAFLLGTSASWLFLRTVPDHTLGVLLGLFVVVFVGTLDDRFSLSPKAKLLGQIAAAILLLLSGFAFLSSTTRSVKATFTLPRGKAGC